MFACDTAKPSSCGDSGSLLQTVWAECCANVSIVLTNDEFRGGGKELEAKTQAPARQRLLRRSLFRHVTQAAAFDQAVKIFGEIGGVIAGTLQGLRHEHQIEA